MSWPQRLSAMFRAAPLSPDDYPNYLAAPRVERRVLPPAKLLICLLLLVAFLPRLLMAFRVGVVCSDGAYYIQLAEALERGDIAQALNMQFNLFPVVLAGLHKLGLSWEVAGKVWGVTMSTLVVLPLFGWVRRQFDDRIAAVACILYAIHPELIEWSPEVVREPTFWFAFTLTIYLLWRAISEVRIGFFLLAGLTMTLGALTRFEALFLVVLLVGWTGIRWWALTEKRTKLIFGALACPLALPTLLLSVNLLWVHQECSLNLLRLEPLKRVENWLVSWSTGNAGSPTTADPAVATYSASPTASGWQALKSGVHKPWMFLHTMERGLTPFFALLMFGGYFAWHRLFNRRDHACVLLVAMLVCAGIWIHLWFTNQASGRYVMSVVVLSTRCAAVGAILVAHWICRVVTILTTSRWLRPVGVLASMLLVLGVIGWIDALSTRFRSRELSAELGNWIRGHFGELRVIFGTDEQLAIISYHAHAYYWEPPRGVRGNSIVDLVKYSPPDVIVVANGAERAKDFSILIDEGRELGFERVDSSLLPHPSDRVIVLSRVPMTR